MDNPLQTPDPVPPPVPCPAPSQWWRDPHALSFATGLTLILGGIGTTVVALVFPPSVAATVPLVVAGLGMLTSGSGVLAASNSGPKPPAGS